MIGSDDVMRYADGVLPADQRPAVREALANDPALMQSFESFLFTRGPIARAFDDVLAAPLPATLLQLVREPASPQTPPATEPVRTLRLARLLAAFRVPALSPAFALPTVAAAVAAGWFAHYALRTDGIPPESRGFAAWASLQQALEQTPGGTPAHLAGGLGFKATFTFASVQRTWCRQYQLDYSTALQSAGLACRAGDGGWRIIALTEPAPPATAPAPGKFAPAGADDSLDEFRAQIKAGDVLGREAEDRLIKGHWQTRP